MDAAGTLLFVLCAVAVLVAVRWVAERTGLPAAALLTVAGIVYALLPGRNIHLQPEIILTYVLPPLLYKAALDSSLIDIRRNLRTVISLSVLLVLATALLIGLGFELLVPGATLAAGVALGAAVAPPDPVAALAVGRKAGLPANLITLIQGEGLLNDATALTILSVAVAAAHGDGFSFPLAVGEFVIAAAGGLLVGWAVARGVRLLRHLRGDPIIANVVSLATPFVAYLIGEELHVAGVLAVVVAGLIVGHDAPRYATGASRLQTGAVWRLVDFVLEGLVFLLIGQQLPTVVRNLANYSTGTILTAVGVTVGVVLLFRPIWLILTQLLPARLSDPSEKKLSVKEVTAMSWSGTRGVISLAAIFTLEDWMPDRDLLHFCTFVVVLVTLIGQGLTFGPLIQRLGLFANKADLARERNEARSAAARAAIGRLDDISEEQHDDVEEEAIEHTRAALQTRIDRYQKRLDLLEQAGGTEVPTSPEYEAALRVRREVIEAQREELLRWRDSGNLTDEGLRVLERELDHEEGLLRRRS